MTWHILNPDSPNHLGESPFWHLDEQRLYWVDIAGRQVHRSALDGGAWQSWALPQEPGCIAPARQQGQSRGWVLALRDGFYRAFAWGAELELLAAAPHDPATTRFNDGKADPLGRFWAGGIYEPRTAPLAELVALSWQAKGTSFEPVVTHLQGGATVANGLAWSPDARTVYWTDTTRHLIRAWDWDAARNRMSHERVFAQWPAKPAGWQPSEPGYGGRPDGAAVDVQGNYWVAMYEGGRVLQLSPTGQVLRDIAVPALCPTMPCLGGPDLKTLFVTTARHGRSAAELQRFPNSGCVFSMRVDVPGLPVNFFMDPRPLA